MAAVFFIGLAALLWLIELADGPRLLSGGGSRYAWLNGTALGFAVLAGSQLTVQFVHQLVRGNHAAGRAVRTDLLRTLLSAVVYFGASFLYLHFELGVNVSGLLATSAALSLIVGLALQTSLGNLFAGISIELEHVARVGDYVRRGSLAGEIVSLRWRSVQLRSDTGSLFILPNSSVMADVLEVIPQASRIRHEVEFTVSAHIEPGLVIQSAMSALRSGVEGLCESDGDEVVLRESQLEMTGYRYAARFYITSMARRNAIGSAVLERIWYELSRREGAAVAFRRTFKAQNALDAFSPELRSRLWKAARLRRYGRNERIRETGICLIVDGTVDKERGVDDSEPVVQSLVAAVLHGPCASPPPVRLDVITYQRLRDVAADYVGPLSNRLCARIAGATDDPYIAYRTFAAFIRQPARREEFLKSAPQRSFSTVPAGTWFRGDSDDYVAHDRCAVLTWSDAALRIALAEASPGEASPGEAS
ncbi:MAG: mechanosensitive ion channel family protein, partial [Pseudomonadota bacterium]|nr:mechanosensitive ion channel family protein [Pseudomonadota bacterium]